VNLVALICAVSLTEAPFICKLNLKWK